VRSPRAYLLLPLEEPLLELPLPLLLELLSSLDDELPMPDEPEALPRPDEPDEPLEPEVPDMPLEPDEPDIPLEPDDPDWPDDPDEPEPDGLDEPDEA
jgi:hypothetical protein